LFEPSEPIKGGVTITKREDIDGCVKQAKFERTLKLRLEENRGKSYDIVGGQ